MGDPFVFPDAELLVLEYLKAQLPNYLAGFDDETDIGIGVPTSWTPASRPYLQISSDGITSVDSRIHARNTVRVVAWSDNTTTSKEHAAIALGVLRAHPGGDGIRSIQELSGAQPARDTPTDGELAAITVRVNLRATRLEPLGS